MVHHLTAMGHHLPFCHPTQSNNYTIPNLMPVVGQFEQLDNDHKPQSDTLDIHRTVRRGERCRKESRKANIILDRIPEDRSNDAWTRNGKGAFVTDLLDSAFNIKCQQGDNAKSYRLILQQHFRTRCGVRLVIYASVCATDPAMQQCSYCWK